MADAAEKTRSVSDPNSQDYDPESPHYDVTADSSSKYYVGPVNTDHKSGDEIRAEVASAVDNVIPGGWLGELFQPMKDKLVQSAYTGQVEAAREGLADGMDLRSPGEAPKTMWENASHEQMVDIISTNADSGAVAVTSEEWVRLGNDLSEHQKAFGGAINDSLSNWEGDAGDAARKHLAEVAKWLGSTANGAVLAGRQQEIHSQTLNETQKAMAANPPVPFSAADANARLAQITNPVQFAMQFAVEMGSYHQQKAARDQAAQVMNRFDETIAGAVTTPKFTAPPTLARTASTTLARQGQGAPGQDDQVKALRSERMDGPGAGDDPSDPGGREDAVPEIPGTSDTLAGQGGQSGSVPEIPGGAGGPGGSVPGMPGSGVPGNAGVPGIPDGARVPGMPGGSVPGIPGSGVPGNVGVPAAAQAPGGFSGGSVPDIPGGAGFSGGTGASGFTPPASVPDLPRGNTIPSGSFSGGGNVPGSGFVPSINSPAARDGERTARMPTVGPQQNRPSVPNLPGGNRIGGGSLGGGAPGGGVPGGGRGSIPGIPGGNTPGGVPGGGRGSIPGIPGGNTPGGVPGGGRFGPGGVPDIPGSGTSTGSSFGPRGGFGPTGGGAGGGMPGGGGIGGGGGMPGGPGGGMAAGRGGPLGGGTSMGAGMVGEEPVVRSGPQQGAAGARGASGAGGMPMGGMGGGAGGGRDEDKEYRVAEYLEGDSELFSPDAVVHPPVIGDWANKQDWK